VKVVLMGERRDCRALRVSDDHVKVELFLSRPLLKATAP
jgi:hypothetical protein